jgi:hypothetical protein
MKAEIRIYCTRSDVCRKVFKVEVVAVSDRYTELSFPECVTVTEGEIVRITYYKD